MFTDGAPSWGGFQIDQTAFPIVLVARLVKLKLINYYDFQNMVRRAANFLMLAGPNTDQERWEENGGLNPNSFSVAVQGLSLAASLEIAFGDSTLATKYKAKADEWQSNLKNWTLIRNGEFGQNYFPRIEIGVNGKWRPDVNSRYTIANKSSGQQSQYTEDEILDGGFLQWILAGQVDPHDPEFTRTLNLYDQYVRKKTPHGIGYLRYLQDSYGENQRGGAWPLLSAERGLVAIERGEDPFQYLEFIQRSAIPSGMIGEQDTLSVRPLAWSHGAYLILRRSIVDHRCFYIF